MRVRIEGGRGGEGGADADIDAGVAVMEVLHIQASVQSSAQYPMLGNHDMANEGYTANSW